MINNPPRNALHSGLPINGLRQLVKLSGYPLQTVVASKLQKEFGVTEEWGYPDRNTQEHRTLDVYGFKALAEENKSGTLIRPNVALLVECKQSALPYFFFQSVAYQNRPIPMFPAIVGVQRLELSAGQTSRQVRPAECLGLVSERFIFGDPPVCASFARAAKKGKAPEEELDRTGAQPDFVKVQNLEITGADAYQNVILPLASAMRHLREYYQPDSTGSVIGATLALAVCVLDAPMVLVTGPSEEPTLALAPWIRVVRCVFR